METPETIEERREYSVGRTVMADQNSGLSVIGSW